MLKAGELEGVKPPRRGSSRGGNPLETKKRSRTEMRRRSRRAPICRIRSRILLARRATPCTILLGISPFGANFKTKSCRTMPSWGENQHSGGLISHCRNQNAAAAALSSRPTPLSISLQGGVPPRKSRTISKPVSLRDFARVVGPLRTRARGGARGREAGRRRT